MMIRLSDSLACRVDGDSRGENGFGREKRMRNLFGEELLDIRACEVINDYYD
jgi:hypothetical protein